MNTFGINNNFFIFSPFSFFSHLLVPVIFIILLNENIPSPKFHWIAHFHVCSREKRVYITHQKKSIRIQFYVYCSQPCLDWFSILGLKKHTRNSIGFNSAEKIFQKPFFTSYFEPYFLFLSHTQWSNNSNYGRAHYDFYNIEARYNAGIGTIKDVLAFSSVSSRIII